MSNLVRFLAVFIIYMLCFLEKDGIALPVDNLAIVFALFIIYYVFGKMMFFLLDIVRKGRLASYAETYALPAYSFVAPVLLISRGEPEAIARISLGAAVCVLLLSDSSREIRRAVGGKWMGSQEFSLFVNHPPKGVSDFLFFTLICTLMIVLPVAWWMS